MADIPTDAELIAGAIESRLLSLHTSMPGKVVTYNPALQTANVQPVIQRAVPTSAGGIEHEELPIIHNVPLEWPGGGGFAMQFPVQPGDHVWLIFSEVATSKWRSTGQVSEPGDLRRHDLSYACALWIRGPNSEALTPLAPPTEARMDCPAPFVFGSQLGAEFVALASLVLDELEAIKSYIDGHTHPVPGGPSPGVSSAPSSPMPTPGSVAATKLKSE